MLRIFCLLWCCLAHFLSNAIETIANEDERANLDDLVREIHEVNLDIVHFSDNNEDLYDLSNVFLSLIRAMHERLFRALEDLDWTNLYEHCELVQAWFLQSHDTNHG